MVECKGCGETDDQLHEDGFCHSCEQDQDVYKLVLRDDWKWESPAAGGKGDPIKTVVCLKCGGDKFIVGDTECYYGVIKCPACGWERCFYSG